MVELALACGIWGGVYDGLVYVQIKLFCPSLWNLVDDINMHAFHWQIFSSCSGPISFFCNFFLIMPLHRFDIYMYIPISVFLGV